MSEFSYAGNELEVFAHALNWKKYWSAAIAGYIRGDVLEVGAGIGSNTPLLCRTPHARWVCLEPDPRLAAQLKNNLELHGLARCEVVVGTIAALPPGETFDTLLYVDTLEHIEDDRAEAARAAARLRPGGHLIVLAPAHQWLFSPFDKAIGHFRRYNRTTLAVAPAALVPERMVYLDAVGACALLANRCLLRSSAPGPRQILFWDRLLVPFSRLLDPLLRHRVGKSILAVWRKPAS
jgi:SAM-dependent methyltransferase